MRHYGSRRRTKTYTTSVIHVPSTMGAFPSQDTGVLFVIASPSILASGSATTNIAQQDKDRTVDVGHHIGQITIDMGISNPIADGILEMCVYKVLRSGITPIIGTLPIPSDATVLSQGLQQSARLALPGLVYHYSKAAFSREKSRNIRIKVSPAKFKQSKMKAGDFWIFHVFNRAGGGVTLDYECRYKEFG